MNFKPTKPQLEKLAKVAKVRHYWSIMRKCWIVPPHNEWQPHLDRDQIAMVIEGLTDDKFSEFIHLLIHDKDLCLYSRYDHSREEYVIGVEDLNEIFKLPAHISCEKLLEVIDGSV